MKITHKRSLNKRKNKKRNTKSKKRKMNRTKKRNMRGGAAAAKPPKVSKSQKRQSDAAITNFTLQICRGVLNSYLLNNWSSIRLQYLKSIEAKLEKPKINGLMYVDTHGDYVQLTSGIEEPYKSRFADPDLVLAYAMFGASLPLAQGASEGLEKKTTEYYQKKPLTFCKQFFNDPMKPPVGVFEHFQEEWKQRLSENMPPGLGWNPSIRRVKCNTGDMEIKQMLQRMASGPTQRSLPAKTPQLYKDWCTPSCSVDPKDSGVNAHIIKKNTDYKKLSDMLSKLDSGKIWEQFPPCWKNPDLESGKQTEMIQQDEKKIVEYIDMRSKSVRLLWFMTVNFKGTLGNERDFKRRKGGGMKEKDLKKYIIDNTTIVNYNTYIFGTLPHSGGSQQRQGTKRKIEEVSDSISDPIEILKLGDIEKIKEYFEIQYNTGGSLDKAMAESNFGISVITKSKSLKYKHDFITHLGLSLGLGVWKPITLSDKSFNLYFTYNELITIISVALSEITDLPPLELFIIDTGCRVYPAKVDISDKGIPNGPIILENL